MPGLNTAEQDQKNAKKIAAITTGSTTTSTTAPTTTAPTTTDPLTGKAAREARKAADQTTRDAERAARRAANPGGGPGTGTTTGGGLGTGIAGRISEITASNSPLMQQAATYGMQSANRRGLGNSSMAVGAGQAEMLKAATPIASQESSEANSIKLQEMSDASRSSIAQMEVASREREAMAGAITKMSEARYLSLASTLNNDKIPAEARNAVIGSIGAQFDGAMNYLQNLYGVKVSDAIPGVAPAPIPGATATPKPTIPTGVGPAPTSGLGGWMANRFPVAG